MALSSNATDAWVLTKVGGPIDVAPDFHPVLSEITDGIRERERALRLREGWPILVGIRNVDWRLNYYLQRIGFRADQLSTATTYATSLKVFLEYLALQTRPGGRAGIDWDEVTRDDLIDYHDWRVYDERNPSVVSPATWNKDLNALSHFYSAALEQGWVKGDPTGGSVLTDRYSEEVGDGFLVEKNARSQRDRWLTPQEFRMWRDVGLRGYSTERLDDGRLEPSVVLSGNRQRNEQRNVAFVKLAATSGLRRQESGGLLLPELPDGTDIAAMLPRTLAKGGRNRTWVVLNAHGLAAVNMYCNGERIAAIKRGQNEGRYEAIEDIIEVRDFVTVRGKGHLVTDEWPTGRPLTQLSLAQRLRTFTRGVDGQLQPLMLWLKESGEPMPPTTWNSVFQAANDKVNTERLRHGLTSPGVNVVPHTLRYTFALLVLVAAMAAIDESEQIKPSAVFDFDRYSHAFDFVKELLGHASVKTTKDEYLEVVKSVRRLDIMRGANAQSILEEMASDTGMLGWGRS